MKQTRVNDPSTGKNLTAVYEIVHSDREVWGYTGHTGED